MKAGTASFDRRLKPGERIDAVDCARGLALVGMALFHLSWDLADYRFVSPMLPFTLPMRLFSNLVASAFLALVGVSLALAHRDSLNLPAFWRRLAIVGGAAALVTTASFVFAPGAPIWFGILHCIAAASLIALPLIEAPAAASLAAGAAAIAIPFVIHAKLFDSPFLLWLGIGEALPNTLDWRPLMPWAGVVFLGLGVARLPGAMARLVSPDRWRARGRPARAVCFAGRHSLPIYLVHQPILIGLVAAAAHSGAFALVAAPKADVSVFLSACQRSCVAGGRPAAACDTSCRCVADAIVRPGAAGHSGGGDLDETRHADLKRMVDACRAR